MNETAAFSATDVYPNPQKLTANLKSPKRTAPSVNLKVSLWCRGHDIPLKLRRTDLEY